MRREAIALGLILLLSGACSWEPQPPVELMVGDQRISVVIPEGWEHLDYGDRHQLRRGLDRISIERAQGAPDQALRRLGEDAQRDVASRTPFQVGRHEGLVIDTWDRLSHQHRKRFWFVEDGWSPLVIYTLSGVFESVESDFDALVASVALVDSAGRVGGEAQPQ